MSKCIAIGMVGFLLGMKCKECGSCFQLRRIKHRALRKLGL